MTRNITLPTYGGGTATLSIVQYFGALLRHPLVSAGVLSGFAGVYAILAALTSVPTMPHSPVAFAPTETGLLTLGISASFFMAGFVPGGRFWLWESGREEIDRRSGKWLALSVVSGTTCILLCWGLAAVIELLVVHFTMLFAAALAVLAPCLIVLGWVRVLRTD